MPHSLASLSDPEEFKIQVKQHDEKIEQLFGVKPKVFRNTELIFSDDIASMIASMGFQGCHYRRGPSTYWVGRVPTTSIARRRLPN